MTYSDEAIVSCNRFTVLGCVLYFLLRNLSHTGQFCISGLYISIVVTYIINAFIIYKLICFRNYGGEYHVCAFLSQQAVEKALKALLIDRTGNFPRIHDVVELSRRVKAPSRITELCANINPAYTSTRYPEVASDFDKGEVEEIVISAEEILEWIKKELKL